MNLDKAINERASCRKFKTKKPNWKKIISAIEAATKAPLAGNIPTVKFILVSNKEKIQKLAKACAQNFISTAHYVVVVCSDKKQCTLSYGERGKKYSQQQAGAAIENFLLKIQSLGLSTCWIGAFSDEQVKDILQLSENVEPIALFPIGYAMQKPKQRKKPDLNSVLYFDIWKNKHMTPIRKPEAE